MTTNQSVPVTDITEKNESTVMSVEDDKLDVGTIRLRLHAELPLFKEWLLKRVGELTATRYVQNVRKFLSEVRSISDPNAYNEYLSDLLHVRKKRTFQMYLGVRHWVNYYFSGKDYRDLRERILRNIEYIKPVYPPSRERPKALDDIALQQVLDNIRDPQCYIVSRICMSTGIRAGDCLRLRRDNFSYEVFNDKIIMVLDVTGKGQKKSVSWIFDPLLMSEIEAFLSDCTGFSDDVFLGEPKKHNKNVMFSEPAYLGAYTRYKSELKRAVLRSGLKYRDFSSHDFRRRYAKLVWEETHDIVKVKNALHHSYVETTVKYIERAGLDVKDVAQSLFDKDKV